MWRQAAARSCRPRPSRWEGFRQLSRGLPATRRQARGHAAAVGELPDLRHHVRHRRARARGRARRLPGDLRLVRLRPGAVRLVVQHLELRLGLGGAFPSPSSGSSGGGGGGRLVRRRRRRRLVERMANEEHRAPAGRGRRSRRRGAARLLVGRPRGRRAVPARVRAAISRVVGGRAAGRLRSSGRHAQGGDPARATRPAAAGVRARGARRRAPSRRPPRTRSRWPAWPRGTTRPRAAAAAQMAAGGEAFERTAAALAALAARDERCLRLGAACRDRRTSKPAICTSRACRSRTPRSCSSGSPRRADWPSTRSRRSCLRSRRAGLSVYQPRKRVASMRSGTE